MGLIEKLKKDPPKKFLKKLKLKNPIPAFDYLKLLMNLTSSVSQTTKSVKVLFTLSCNSELDFAQILCSINKCVGRGSN